MAYTLDVYESIMPSAHWGWELSKPKGLYICPFGNVRYDTKDDALAAGREVAEELGIEIDLERIKKCEVRPNWEFIFNETETNEQGDK